MAEQLAPVIAEALARIDEVIAGQQEFDPARATRLFTIAPNSHLEFALVPAIVAQLRAHAPGIRLRLTPYGSDLAETGVISGTTAMVLGRIVDPSGQSGRAASHGREPGLRGARGSSGDRRQASPATSSSGSGM